MTIPLPPKVIDILNRTRNGKFPQNQSQIKSITTAIKIVCELAGLNEP